jgi:threonine dehydratase
VTRRQTRRWLLQWMFEATLPLPAPDVKTPIAHRGVMAEFGGIEPVHVPSAPAAARRITLDRIEAAGHAIDPVFLHTPQWVCEPLGDELGLRIALKAETLNPIRSFKGRGADWLVQNLPPGAALMCASAGNFGQAMAYACRKHGVPLTVYAAKPANPLKIERMRAMGAEVVLVGDDFDAAKAHARAHAARERIRFVEDSRDPEPTEGAGTMALEWLSFPERLDALLIPLGNGAMLAGMATVIKTRLPETRVVAVAATGAPAMVESLRSGRMVTHERIDTIADGIGVRLPVPEALIDLTGLVDEFILVPDDLIVAAMCLLHRHAGLVAEPSGAVGLAGVMQEPARFRRQTVGTVICGGNLTPEQMNDWLG